MKDNTVNTSEETEDIDRRPWWSGGLHFECLGCGRCCRGEPGGIFVTPEEEKRIAAFLELSADEFRRRYETGRWRFPSVKESRDGRCVMNCPDNRCRVYALRPVTCRTWPFWPEVLASPEAWNAAAAQCPGMNSGPLWEAWQIDAVCQAQVQYMQRLAEAWRKERC